MAAEPTRREWPDGELRMNPDAPTSR
jgi:hypothetical protein